MHQSDPSTFPEFNISAPTYKKTVDYILKENSNEYHLERHTKTAEQPNKRF